MTTLDFISVRKTFGTTVALDTVAVRGGSGTAHALGALPAPGSPYLLPDASVPSDHVPLVAEIT